jgi:carboxyl-terminal processing protease
MKRQLSLLWILGLVFLALMAGLLAGMALDRRVFLAFTPPSNIPAGAEPAFQLIAEGWNVIHSSYVGRAQIEDQQLIYGAISGMTDALGDVGHSRFLTPEMVQAQHDFTAGNFEFEGIGAYVESRNGSVVIVAPLDNSPAQRAGLQPGDVILSVNGEDMSGLPLNEVVQRVLGPAGTEVTLTILRPDTGETQDYTLQRARIDLQNVTWQQLPGTTVAHLRITTFSRDATTDLQQALTEIQQQGLSGVILDLRNNPGGLLEEAIGVTSQFLAEGNVMQRQNAAGEIMEVPVRPGGVALDIPLNVLINNGSASASEIVAGALQDTGRAVLVGETTFGTGTVLNEFSLSDGSALLLATEQWLTPDGRVIWHTGIVPDVTIPLPATVQLLVPEAERTMTAEALQASEDQQLLRALELLTASE